MRDKHLTNNQIDNGRKCSKKALDKWIRSYDWDVMGSLAFNKKISKEQAIEQLQRYWHVIDTGYFNNNACRHNHRVQRFNIYHNGFIGSSEYFSEYYNEEHPHFHFVAKAPHKHLKSFIRVLEEEWSEEFGRRNTTLIQKITDRKGMVEYFLREHDKLGNDTIEAYTTALYNGDEYEQLTQNGKHYRQKRKHNHKKPYRKTFNTSTNPWHKKQDAKPVKTYTPQELLQLQQA